MLLFCTKTIVKESHKFELAHLKEKKKKKKKKKEKHFGHLVTFWFSTFSPSPTCAAFPFHPSLSPSPMHFPTFSPSPTGAAFPIHSSLSPSPTFPLSPPHPQVQPFLAIPRSLLLPLSPPHPQVQPFLQQCTLS